MLVDAPFQSATDTKVMFHDQYSAKLRCRGMPRGCYFHLDHRVNGGVGPKDRVGAPFKPDNQFAGELAATLIPSPPYHRYINLTGLRGSNTRVRCAEWKPIAKPGVVNARREVTV